MLFELTDAPAIFQHMINDVFREFLDDFVVIFENDIFIYSKNKEDNEKCIRMVLNKLCNMELYAKLPSCMPSMPNSHMEYVNFINLKLSFFDI